MTQVSKRYEAKVTKVNADLGMVYGYAIVCHEGDEPYFDLQGDHITEEAMMKAAVEFAKGGALMDAMHDEKPIGKILHMLPMTREMAKGLGLSTTRSGLIVGAHTGPEYLRKFDTGEWTGFSIGGKCTRRDYTAGEALP